MANIIVVHEWWGQNQHARDQALRLAKEGYLAFALDMYGKGKMTTQSWRRRNLD